MIVVNVKCRRYSFMNKIITHIAFIWLLFAPMLTLAQTKRALVIGIGRQEDSAWNKINGDKDVPYVLEILNDANYEQIITCVNEEATKKAPTVICFDELDGMVPDRSTIHNEGASGEVNEFLSQLNNCSERGIFVIGTSNRPEKIDPAILRTGRMDKMVYIPMPDVEARKELFKIHLADGVLVDFESALAKQDEQTLKEYEGRYDEIPGLFGQMLPMYGAIEAVHRLNEYYDCYILSTAPWKNPSAWSDKVLWVTRYLDDVFHKRMVITHCKNLCKGDILIDDRGKNGTSEFEGEWIQFGSERFPDWKSVLDYLLPNGD